MSFTQEQNSLCKSHKGYEALNNPVEKSVIYRQVTLPLLPTNQRDLEQEKKKMAEKLALVYPDPTD